MYYSSEGSDSENGQDSCSLDFSYLLLDSESFGLHLKNSIQERVDKIKSKKETPPSLKNRDSKLDLNLLQLDSSEVSVRKRSQTKRPNLESDLEEIQKDLITDKLLMHHNLLLTLPFEVTLFPNIRFLDLSNNNLSHINDFLLTLVNLQTLYIKNNDLQDGSLPKDLSPLTKLRELNLSGNKFTRFPPQLYDVVSLKYLYLGSNDIIEVLPDVKNLQNLQVLHLGGNQLETVPDELGQLQLLGVLALCDNRLRRLPRSISYLTRLRSLLLHKNALCCLPVGIVKLRSLTELSLRDNPLVERFVTCCAKGIMYAPPSLLELAARVIKLKGVPVGPGDIPGSLERYVDSGQKCVNPRCKGMYFTTCVEHIKFVDFCGKFRVPLMHYLCSTKCSSSTPAFYDTRADSEEEEEQGPDVTLQRVLLG